MTKHLPSRAASRGQYVFFMLMFFVLSTIGFATFPVGGFILVVGSFMGMVRETKFRREFLRRRVA